MLLFADEGQINASTIITIVGMVAAGIGGAAASIFAYLTARNKLKYDAEFLLLKKNYEECEADHKETKTQMVLVNQRCERAEHAAALAAGELAGANRELKSLREDVDQLRKILYQRTGG